MSDNNALDLAVILMALRSCEMHLRSSITAHEERRKSGYFPKHRIPRNLTREHKAVAAQIEIVSKLMDEAKGESLCGSSLT